MESDSGRRRAPSDDEDQETSVSYKAEYIWIDGTEPTPALRSKTKILEDGKDLPIWGFDGSSTNQAPGEQLRLRAAAGVRRARTRSAVATTSS